MASPVVEQVVENATTSAGTSHTINLPTATAGHLLLIILDKGSTAATINAHASLTELLDENSANGLYIAYRQMDGTEPSSYTLTSSASTRTASLAYRISGHIIPTVQAPQIGTTGTGTSATPDPPSSASPGSTQDYLFIAFAGMAGEEADDDTWGNTPPTNYTPSPPRQKACGVAGTNLGGLILSAERALNTGSAENPGTFGVDTSAAWRSQTIMVSPANPQSVTPGKASLALAVFAAAVTITANVLVTPGKGSLSLSSFAPTVTAPTVVIPSTASLTLSSFEPTVSAADNRTVTPSPAALVTQLFAPEVTATADVFSTPEAYVTPSVVAAKGKVRGPYSDPRIFEEYIKRCIAERESPREEVGVAVLKQSLVKVVAERRVSILDRSILIREMEILERLATVEKAKRDVSVIEARVRRIAKQLQQLEDDEMSMLLAAFDNT